MDKIRCPWAERNPLEQEYHDLEWGVPSFDDGYLFEMLVLESMQAGLSWTTIIQKREHMRVVFDDFNPESIKEYGEDKIEELLEDAGIIRHEAKIKAMIGNAQAFLDIQKEYGSFSDFIWKYVNHKPILNTWQRIEEVPSQTDLSNRISKDLKKRGFKFLGPTTIYAYMQAIGMVDDHITTCFIKNK